MKKTNFRRLFAFCIILISAFTFFACNSNDDDAVIKEQQGKIELTKNNLASNRFYFTLERTGNNHELSNGVNGNSLLSLKTNQSIQFARGDNFANLVLPLKENGKVVMQGFNGTWEITGSNTIKISNITNGTINHEDIILNDVILERTGNVENEIYYISYNYRSNILDDIVTIKGDTKQRD